MMLFAILKNIEVWPNFSKTAADECTIAYKRSLEALNRTLKNLTSKNTLFGGVLILLLEDFHQILPVITRLIMQTK